VIVSSPIQLACDWSGDPAPIIVWKKDGRALDFHLLGFIEDDTEELKMVNRVEQLSNGALRIRDAGVEDGGLYECLATSEAGSAVKHVMLQVLGRYIVGMYYY